MARWPRPQLLPADLCALLADLSMDASAYPISNARELDLATSSPVLAEAVRSALSAHPTVRAAAEHLFGVTRFVVPNLKLLESLEVRLRLRLRLRLELLESLEGSTGAKESLYHHAGWLCYGHWRPYVVSRAMVSHNERAH
jgi:hypothetical protein